MMSIKIRLCLALSQIFNRKYFLWVPLLTLGFSSLNAQQVIQEGNALYLSNTLMVKLKSSTTSAQLNKILSKHSVISTKEIFPSSGKLNKADGSDILSGIYLVNYNSTEDPASLSAEISKLPEILWAEPKFVRTVCYSPSDSLFLDGKQENLAQIDATKAWDISTGNKKIIIGIIDIGVDWMHPDLAANIYKENGSLIPGSDLGGLHGILDDDPSEDIDSNQHYHGTLIAGIASAVTDNEIGVASIGFNCSIMPVKASKDDSRITGIPIVLYGFEGIKWAADHGANIINCSWGGYPYSSYEQSIIDYAIAKGAIIVASYGNDSSLGNFYPASYKGVLSVGWLETGVGVKTVNPGANYGESVKVFAPGTNIYSTWQRQTKSSPGIYVAGSGSSISAPLVSGLAGLVWSKFPFYTPMQVLERIRVTSEFIDDYNESKYRNLLGHGLINASRAVDETIRAISIRADSIHFEGSGNQEGIFGPGEEVSVKMNFTNYLSTVDNVTVKLTTTDNYITIENSTFNTGPMDTLTTISNVSNEFKFRIDRNTPDNHIVHFLLVYSNGTDYKDFQWTTMKITDSYYTHSNNNITLTVTSKGTLGFNDFPYNLVGEGFKYKGSGNLMFEGALMYGVSSTQVMDEARILDQQKKDFMYSAPIKTWSDEDASIGIYYFSDSGAVTNALGVKTTQASLSYTKDSESNYIMLISRLFNSYSQDIKQLYAGYFIDWNIPESNYYEDTTYFDNVNKIAITYNISNPSTPYTAMSLISSRKDFGFYAIDNNLTSGPVQINDANGFSDEEKWYALSNGVKRSSAGVGDISYVISGGPYDIPAGQDIQVIFAIAAGSTLMEVIYAIKACRVRFGVEPEEPIPLVFQLFQNYPNPFNPSTTIQYNLAKGSRMNIVVYDLLGREVAILVDETKKAGSYQVTWNASSFASGIYFYRLQAGDYIETKKLLLLK
jgi:serine protease